MWVLPSHLSWRFFCVGLPCTAPLLPEARLRTTACRLARWLLITAVIAASFYHRHLHPRLSVYASNLTPIYDLSACAFSASRLYAAATVLRFDELCMMLPQI
jgi:hypothetical protein